MKKHFYLLIILLIGYGFTAQAQELKFGLKAGLNLSNLKSSKSYLDNYESRILFHGGVLVDIPLNNKFAIQPELIYSAEGAKHLVGTTQNPLSGDLNPEYNLNYLILPIMTKYYFLNGFNVQLGPQIGYLLSGKLKSVENTGILTVNLKDNMKRLTFGLNFGVGYELNNGINFSFRYNLGLSDISNYDNENAGSLKYSVFQLSIGYFL